MPNRKLILAAVLSLSGCIHPAPHTEYVQLDDPKCDGTVEGNACLTMSITIDDATRKQVSHPLQGALHWALYKGGDVSVFGPGNSTSVLGGTLPGIDMSAPDAVQEVTIPNLAPKAYQSLAFLDVTNAGLNVATSGDPVTFPSDPFDVPANQHTRVAVVMDFIR